MFFSKFIFLGRIWRFDYKKVIFFENIFIVDKSCQFEVVTLQCETLEIYFMGRDELLIFCKYYKGELASPYERDSVEGLFWFLERMYVDNSIRSEGFRLGWIHEAENYIAVHPNERNILTDNNVNIETKAIILYIEIMLSKWKPYEVDLIFKY